MKSSKSVSSGVRAVLVVIASFVPVFVATAAVPGDEHWDNQFGPVGANDVLRAVTASGRNIFVGDFFSAAGNTKASLVAGYDGTNWFALNNGIPGIPGSTSSFVWALAADAHYVYAGGIFTNADGSGAQNIARWDGTNWLPLGGDFNSVVQVIKIIGTNLYAGGYFSTNGGIAVNGIARWNGANWSAFGTGIAGDFANVAAIESDGVYLYIGGTFSQAGGIDATNIAR